MSPTSYRTALSRDIRLSQSLIIIAEGGAVVKGVSADFFVSIRGYPTIYQTHSSASVTAPKIIQARMLFLPVRCV